ncbi:MAG: lipid carrier--UDP-N-acetylgalactosaminyltransferase [Cytophagaceae bacterium]|jgi:lipopolysaccharide/colanic/teichoic acid biosynthesis glycosyltransferase|nr:lipid carrier--UDP-N-acetylgalactosaminyltransferase [Cytophagaceae bacterium]
MYRKGLKRLIDLMLSGTAFIIALPVFLLTAFVLYILNDGKPFFFQVRPGKQAKLFTVIKFKTMNDKKDHMGNLLPDAQRLTVFGQWVRKTSLDEIPQLLNVIKGDMSLIGPRPLLVEYLPLYNSIQARRHDVRPGITGWAQVNGRNAISWDRKFELDVWYVEHLSWLLDLKIVFLTVFKVFKREGISSDTSATMEKFTGSK